MLSFRILAGLACASIALGAPPRAAAQTPTSQAPASPAPTPADVQQLRAELDRLKKEFDAVRQLYGDRLLALEQQIGQLTQGPSTGSIGSIGSIGSTGSTGSIGSIGSIGSAGTAGTQAAGQQPTPPTPPQEPPPAATPAGSSKVFNPDISAIGNFVGVAGKNPFSTQRPLELTEAEVAFQAIVDPYAKADFFLSASPEGLEVEEGYVTFTSLPANLLLKVGKMRAQFGKVNTLHTTRCRRWIVRSSRRTWSVGRGHLIQASVHLFDNPVKSSTGEVYAGNSPCLGDERSKLNYRPAAQQYDAGETRTSTWRSSGVRSGPGALLEPVDIRISGR